MSELTIQMPETLRSQLDHLASEEGIPLNQYVLYALTRQVTSGYIVRRVPLEEVQKQSEEFAAIRQRWKDMASDKDVDQILAEREIAEPEPGLTPELVAKIQTMITAARSQRSAQDFAEKLKTN
jgi:response regulator of citrate/malate metabolism